MCHFCLAALLGDVCTAGGRTCATFALQRCGAMCARQEAAHVPLLPCSAAGRCVHGRRPHMCHFCLAALRGDVCTAGGRTCATFALQRCWAMCARQEAALLPLLPCSAAGRCVHGRRPHFC